MKTDFGKERSAFLSLYNKEGCSMNIPLRKQTPMHPILIDPRIPVARNRAIPARRAH